MTTAVASRPRLLVVAGPNGAGKTTITERGLAHEWFHECEYVNPDAMAQELGDWNDAATVLRAAQLATERREACLRELRSLAFETVFRRPTSRSSCAERSRWATSFEYSLSALIDPRSTPLESPAECSKAGTRFRSARLSIVGATRSRMPPLSSPRVDRSTSATTPSTIAIANAASVVAEVDRFYVYDNSVDDRDALLVLRAADGRVVKAYGAAPTWAGPILERLSPP